MIARTERRFAGTPAWRVSSLWREITAPQLFVGSFLLLIALGTLGLKTLPGIYTGEPLNWLDALFTATSAVCVTGLIVVDTATYFTTWGQAYLLLLVQIGGLGMITFTTLIILALGRRLSLRHETISTGGTEVAPMVDFRHLTRDVVLFTLSLEAIGAALLYLLWVPDFGWTGAVWPAVFHAVSAFCNAGFSIFSDSLMSFQDSPALLWVVMTLVVLGGLGFLTLEELYLRRRAGREGRAFRISLHSRIVLVTTGALLLAGWIVIGTFEWNLRFANMTLWERLTNAMFASVTPRTAGFNTIDYGTATANTNFFTILLMFIGGSPGSVAAGIKTTTVALLALLAWSRFRGREVVSFWGRSVPNETVQRAVGLAVVAFSMVTLAIFVYTTTELGGVSLGEERIRFLDHMFEAVSAFSTVGLSMGVTAELSDAGRWTTIILMYVGRVGPLTFAAALAFAARKRIGGYRYAREDVIVG